MSPALLQLLIEAGIKYGPTFVTDIIALFKKQDVTIDEIEQLFANVKPLASYNIKVATT